MAHSGEGTMTALFVFVLGLILGSFANVVICRLPKNRSIIRPASHCVHCRKKIRAYDNIPLLSFILLKGKCRHCRKQISMRYPVVEFLMGLLFLAEYYRFGWSPLLFVRDFPFVFILLCVAFIDLENRIIPDELSLGGVVLGLLTSFAVPELGIIHSCLGAAFGFIVFYALAWSYFKMSGQSGLGGGDIKLLAMLGAFLGFQGVFVVLVLSSLGGSLAGVFWALWNKEKNILKTSIPFGPFLVGAGIFYDLIGNPLWLQFMIPI